MHSKPLNSSTVQYWLIVSVFIFILSISFAKTATAQTEPLILDGRTTDWTGIEVLGTDPTGDAGSNAVDFDSLWVDDQNGWFFVRFNTNDELILQGMDDVTLWLDTDNDSDTGYETDGIGAEFRFNFGDRQGHWFQPNGNSSGFEHAEVQLMSAPTVSGETFEAAFRLNAEVNGDPVFPGAQIQVAVSAGSQDRIPDDGGFLFTISGGGGPDLPVLSLDRAEGTHVRAVSWNVLFDGIIERPDPFNRLFDAIVPDIVSIQEVWSAGAAEIRNAMDQYLPLPDGSWHVEIEDDDIALASRWPISDSWDIPDSRAGAFLVDLPDDSFDTDLFVIGAHPPCCDNETGRQRAIDAFMGFLRDAQEGTGVSQIPENTPILITGDMNLVGWRQQQTTLYEGVIVNGEYGPSFDPDWDGTALEDALPRHTHEPQTYTWRNDGSSYSPGRLDYVVYSGSVLEALHGFILDTEMMPAGARTAYGLEEQDSPDAADHRPVVVDFALTGLNAVDEPDRSSAKNQSIDFAGNRLDVWSTPGNPSLVIEAGLAQAGHATLQVFDILGRHVRTLAEAQRPSGSWRTRWTGTTSSGATVSSGLYIITLTTDQGIIASKGLLAR